MPLSVSSEQWSKAEDCGATVDETSEGVQMFEERRVPAGSVELDS